MMELTSKQRKVLEKAAHGLEPLVIVGQNGVTPSLTQMVDGQLKAHELIKVKFNEFKEERLSLAGQLAQDCRAVLVRVIGNIAILYRESDEPEKRHFRGAIEKAAKKRRPAAEPRA